VSVLPDPLASPVSLPARRTLPGRPRSAKSAPTPDRTPGATDAAEPNEVNDDTKWTRYGMNTTPIRRPRNSDPATRPAAATTLRPQEPRHPTRQQIQQPGNRFGNQPSSKSGNRKPSPGQRAGICCKESPPHPEDQVWPTAIDPGPQPACLRRRTRSLRRGPPVCATAINPALRTRHQDVSNGQRSKAFPGSSVRSRPPASRTWKTTAGHS
jgi:hypothetical protein